MEAPEVGGLRTAHRARLDRHQGTPALLKVESTTLLGACPPRRAPPSGINRLGASGGRTFARLRLRPLRGCRASGSAARGRLGCRELVDPTLELDDALLE